MVYFKNLRVVLVRLPNTETVTINPIHHWLYENLLLGGGIVLGQFVRRGAICKNGQKWLYLDQFSIIFPSSELLCHQSKCDYA